MTEYIDLTGKPSDANGIVKEYTLDGRFTRVVAGGKVLRMAEDMGELRTGYTSLRQELSRTLTLIQIGQATGDGLYLVPDADEYLFTGNLTFASFRFTGSQFVASGPDVPDDEFVFGARGMNEQEQDRFCKWYGLVTDVVTLDRMSLGLADTLLQIARLTGFPKIWKVEIEGRLGNVYTDDSVARYSFLPGYDSRRFVASHRGVPDAEFVIGPNGMSDREQERFRTWHRQALAAPNLGQAPAIKD